MKKKLLQLLAFICLIGVFYLSIDISLKIYFNNFFYYTPNFIGMNIDDIKLLTNKSPIRILEVSQEFSKESQNTVFMQEPLANKVIKKNRIVKVWVSKGANDTEVPSVTGLNYTDAKSIIESKGYKIGEVFYITTDIPTGEVISTEPPAGSLLSYSDKINFLVNKKFEVSTVEMPDLIGLTFKEATTILRDNSLLLGNVKYENFESIEPDTVVETSVEYRTKLSGGSFIDFTVSK
ncbi:MAG: PASTA domain-containing protein [Fusobacteriaceae bacterium]